jgi:hypothetical protein
MEFKKNRQTAMVEGIAELKVSPALARPGLFSDAKEIRAIQSGQKKADSRVRKLKARYVKALASPAEHDPVYKICQRIFHKVDGLVLTREMPERRVIRRRALRRFLLGYPPRKKADTSMGDAFNWEWMLECANSQNAELVIVSRDSDYGALFENRWYPNDHLVQEFRERVSRKRKLLLYGKLSDALQHFKIKVTQEEKEEEEAIAVQPVQPSAPSDAGSAALSSAFASLQSPELQERLRKAIESFAALQENPQSQERLRVMREAIANYKKSKEEKAS